MKTVSLNVENLCVPCSCRCRHCLLSFDGGVPGAEYARGKALGRRLKAESPVGFSYYIGFCMDTPELLDYIVFCREIDSPGGSFLQMNGFAVRPYREMERLMGAVRDAGVELVDLTFYGLPEYHDRFAGRSGDFALLTDMLRAANAVSLPVHISGPLTEENAGQAAGLLDFLAGFKTENIRFYLPHAKGRGWFLEPARLRKATLDMLSQSVRDRMPEVTTRTEAEWLRQGDLPEPEARHMTLSVTAENVGKYEDMSADEILTEMEALDDDFRSAVPAASELARRYGDEDSDRLYRYRDLVLLWTRRYLKDSGLTLRDMTDERGHFSAWV